MRPRFKETLLICIPLFLIPFLVLAFQKYQIKSQSYQKASISMPVNTISTIPQQTSNKAETDLSYIMIVGDKDLNIEVKNNSGSTIGTSYTEGPIVPPGATLTPMKATKTYNYQEPTSGIYTAILSNPNNKPYKFEVYLYDKNGDSKIEKFTESKNVVLQINYNKENLKNSSVTKQP